MESAYLVCQVGARDPGPEHLVTFCGIVPCPVGDEGHKRKRVEVTIRLFELDTREILLEERAETILELHLAMSAVGHPDLLTSRAASSAVDRVVDRRSPRSKCAKAFHDPWLSGRHPYQPARKRRVGRRGPTQTAAR